MQAPNASFRPQDLDYTQALLTLRRAALPIALATVLSGALTYAVESRQPNIFESVSSVLAAQDASQNTLINNTLVTAPPLPLGALDQALHSQGVVDVIVQQLQRSALAPSVRARLSDALNLEIRTQTFNLVTVKDKLDSQQRGVYELHATGLTPGEAQILANAAVTAVLNWDTNRAQVGVARAKSSLQAQVADLNAQVTRSVAGSPERDALISTLGQVSQNLAQVGVFEKAASGPLTLVAEGNRPLLPVSPKPRRNAAIAALVALLTGIGLALSFDSLRRRVNAPIDLLDFQAPVLGSLPRIAQRDLSGGYLAAAPRGATYEQVGFLRVALQERPVRFEQRRVVVSSARPGEGKSSVAASLAQSFALAGNRVLLIDADLHRPTQHRLWNIGESLTPPLTVSGGGDDGRAPVSVAEHIDLIPAGSGSNGANALSLASFETRLDRWAKGYDVVIIDTPPLLSVADALSVGRYSDGVLFVIEAGQTRLTEVFRAVQSVINSQTTLIGFVLNKATAGISGYDYHYRYGEQANTVTARTAALPEAIGARR